MLQYHLLVALRSLRRRIGYALVNVCGLALGVASCLLILHFVLDERAYDRFHENGDRVHRLVTEGEFSAVGWPYSRILEEEFPEVEAVTYLRTWPTFPLVAEGERYYERLRYADARFFDVFGFPLREGDPRTALTEPYTLVLSEDLARRLFGSGPALGRTLTLGDTLSATVTGVAHVPRRSHLQFDALLSFETLRVLQPEMVETSFESGWLNVNLYTYVLLRPDASAERFAMKVRDLPMQRAGEYHRSAGVEPHLGVEHLHAIYLHSPLGSGLGPSGDAGTVYLLGVVGLFVLLLASVNFVNLSTARSTERAKEVGVRKSLGSSRHALVGQFLAESVLVASVAVVLGIGLSWLVLPHFSALTDRTYTLADLVSPRLAAAALVLVAGVGGLAGLYPALVLSRFHPAQTLRGRLGGIHGGVRLRQGLVVFQFAITSVLLVGTLVVLQQLRHMQTQPLGFDAEQVLVLDARRAPMLAERYEAVKAALAEHTGVLEVTAAGALPGRPGWRGQLAFPEGRSQSESVDLEYIPVDHDYSRALGLEVIAGRDLDPTFSADAEDGLLINEAAARAGGWSSPQEAIGKRFPSPGSGKPNGVVIGVVRDHHHHGLREPIGPAMYGVTPEGFWLLALRIDAARIPDVLAHVERVWGQAFSGFPYTTSFLNEDFALQYAQERRMARVFGTFAGLAVLIACLGLFGLSAYATEVRRKEVGIRKALGATIANLVALLSKDFLKLVGLGFVVAVPLAYLAANRWLEGFAHPMHLGPGVFLAAGAAALLLALLTVGTQAFRAASADPVKALRSE